ncbi:MAG: ABC transporter permease [Acidobacteria bacterium]|nr:ABC transporter permease [Acidobacteriota bacterium]
MVVRALVRRNLGHYWRTNLAVVGGVAVAVAVLAGALLVGTSVRSSLRALALERLGAIDRVVTTGRFVSEETAGALLAADGVAAHFPSVVPMVAVEGFVTHQASGRRASGVQVYGVDDRFWTFHDRDPGGLALDRNGAFVSDGLAGELGVALEDALLVRVEKPSAVPISSLHGRRDDVGRTLRLGVTRVLAAADLGEFSFRPAQGLARSVFVPLSRLQEELETEGRVNTLLLGGVSATAAADDGGDAVRQEIAEAAVRATATLADLGLRVRALPEQGTVAVESDAGLLTDATVEAVESVAAARGLAAEPILSYLANELRVGDRITPYSVVTARDLTRLDAPAPAGGAAPEPPAVILNQWAADDLDAGPGDSLTIEYYLWEDEGALTTHEAELRVAGVVPIEGAAADPDLTPDYPGITEATDVIDWDPPFPVDLGLIRPVDETYWDDYRTTPKAFIPLAAGQQLWSSRWGQVTSVRLTPADGGAAGLAATASEVEVALRTGLDPLALGFVVYPARTLALEASAGATDFGLYFIYFSFFLVVSALLLASLFFRLGVEQRLRELGLLRATGWTPRAIRGLFLSEALVLSAAGSAIGVGGAVAYAWLIMLGFRTLWIDAVGTTRLALDPSPATLAAGAAGGILAALLSLGLIHI